MRVAAEGLGDDLLELGFDLVDSLSGCKARAVADPKYVRVDGERFLPKRSVENDVRGFAPNPRQRLQLFAGARHLAAILIDQRMAKADDVLRLSVEQADGLDGIA